MINSSKWIDLHPSCQETSPGSPLKVTSCSFVIFLTHRNPALDEHRQLQQRRPEWLHPWHTEQVISKGIAKKWQEMSKEKAPRRELLPCHYWHFHSGITISKVQSAGNTLLGVIFFIRTGIRRRGKTRKWILRYCWTLRLHPTLSQQWYSRCSSCKAFCIYIQRATHL